MQYALAQDTKVANGILIDKGTAKAMVTGAIVYDIIDDPADYEEVARYLNGSSPSPGRRLMQLSENNGEGKCFVYYGRMEFFQVRDLCQNYKNNVDTFVLKLVKSSCRTDLNEAGEPKDPSAECPTVATQVRVNREICHVLDPQYDTSLLCQPPIEDINKAAKIYEIASTTPLDAPSEKLGINLKANCQSVTDPSFESWFLSAQLTQRIDCPSVGTSLPSPSPKQSNGDSFQADLGAPDQGRRLAGVGSDTARGSRMFIGHIEVRSAH
jgi:hypothetical protein